MCLRWLAALSLLAVLAQAATRPRYGGVLRVEISEPDESADPPQTGPGPADLERAFNVTHWEPGRRATYTADENATDGRPFLDAVEIELARPLREQSIDLELGKTDVVELGPNEARRLSPGRRVWSSSPVRIVVIEFSSRVDDPRIREALALAVDRAAILNVILQRQGEASGALLPQWLSGYAFAFPAAADMAKARALVAAAPTAARAFSLEAATPALRAMADRIALNARDAGLSVTVASASGTADARLLEVRIASPDPARALAEIAAALGLNPQPRAGTPDDLYAAEHALLEGDKVVPLFHLPDVYGAAARVKGAGAIGAQGQWRFENLWLESGQP